jgi:AcrR family transcriptional regulator
MTTAKRTRSKAKATGSAAPKRGKRSASGEKTKQAILQAALALFSQKGFQHTTAREIARKAKIAEGTLIHCFKTKEDLALYFFERELYQLIGWFGRQKHLRKAPLAEKLFAIIHRQFEQFGPYEDFIGAVCLRTLHPASRLCPLSLERRELNLRYLRFIQEVLSQSEEAKEIPSLGEFGPYGFALFHLAIIAHWLRDRSPGKENTLALLDRSLKVAASVSHSIFKKGGWEW